MRRGGSPAGCPPYPEWPGAFGAWPLKATVAMGLGVGVFSALAIVVNVKNRQRSTLFQIASAAALTSSSLAVSLSATGGIAPWCWWLWLLMAMQATAGILVVHARLDARIASRGTTPGSDRFRRAAMVSLIALVCAAVIATIIMRGWYRAGPAAGSNGLRVRSPQPAAGTLGCRFLSRRSVSVRWRCRLFMQACSSLDFGRQVRFRPHGLRVENFIYSIEFLNRRVSLPPTAPAAYRSLPAWRIR